MNLDIRPRARLTQGGSDHDEGLHRGCLYVSDFVAAALAAGDNEESNVGSGTPLSLNRIVAATRDALGADVDPEYGPKR